MCLIETMRLNELFKCPDIEIVLLLNISVSSFTDFSLGVHLL